MAANYYELDLSDVEQRWVAQELVSLPKSPTYMWSKEPYILSKEPYILSKEPHILSI